MPIGPLEILKNGAKSSSILRRLIINQEIGPVQKKLFMAS